ncbi:MAG TPA: hypothetical protein VJH94_05610 [Candidatus Paceibacterota bacterium]
MTKKTTTILSILTTLGILIPSMLYAARFDTVVGRYVDGLKTFGGVMVALAVFFVMVGVFRYIGSGDDPQARAESSKVMFWGVITIAVMMMMWGLVNIVIRTFFSPSELNSFQIDNRLWNSQ